MPAYRIRLFHLLLLALCPTALLAQSRGRVVPGSLPSEWRSQRPGCLEIPDWQVHEYNPRLYILRQSPCANYEKPFVFLIFGETRALLLDTGAAPGTLGRVILSTVKQWLARNNRASIPLTVVHTHEHGDHVAGDAELLAINDSVMPVTLVPATLESTKQFYGIRNWPNDVGQVDLGGRTLDLIPMPGHSRVSVALYDRQTGILFTGDALYPGRLYVADFAAFKASTDRLVHFTASRPVAHVLGNHVEQQATPFLDYPTGTIFQPDEHEMALSRGALLELSDVLASMTDTTQRVAVRDFTVWPNASNPSVGSANSRNRMPTTSIAQVALKTLIIPGFVDFLAADGEEVWATNRGRVEKLSVNRLDPVMTVAVPAPCGAMDVGFGALWVADCQSASLFRIDTDNGRVVARIATGLADPRGELSVSVGAGSVWVLSDSAGVLTRVDPQSNQIVARINVAPKSYAAAFGFGSLWIANTGDPRLQHPGSVQRIDPSSNTVVATIPVGPIPRFLTAGEGGVWTLNQGDGTVSRIDPSTNSLAATIDAGVPGGGGDITAGAGRVWVRASAVLLSAIDPQFNRVTERFGPTAGSGAVRVAGDLVYVTAHDTKTVWVLKR